jgi:hypothetical protein
MTSKTPSQKMIEHFKYDDNKTLLSAIRNKTGKMTDNYKVPTNDRYQGIREVLEAIHNEDLDKLIPSMKKMQMRARRIKSTDTHDFSNVLFFYSIDKDVCDVTFFWRFGLMKIPDQISSHGNPVDPLILEEPHIGYDGTSRATTVFFAETSARILLMNGVHPKSSSDNPNCQKKSSLSDPAHSTKTLYHKAHSVLSELYPYAFYAQIHGMNGANKPTASTMLVANGFNSRFTRSRKSGPELFCQCLPLVFNEKQCRKVNIGGIVRGEAFGKQLSNPNNSGMFDNFIFRRATGVHNTNVQGHQLNGGDQCKVGIEDTGRFMHVELTGTFRDNKSKRNCQKLALVLNEMMKKWVGDDTYENIDIVDSEIDDFQSEDEMIETEESDIEDDLDEFEESEPEYDPGPKEDTKEDQEETPKEDPNEEFDLDKEMKLFRDELSPEAKEQFKDILHHFMGYDSECGYDSE